MKKAMMMAMVAVGVVSSVSAWAATSVQKQNVLIGFQGDSSDIVQVIDPNLPVQVTVKSASGVSQSQTVLGDTAITYGIKNTFAMAPSAHEMVLIMPENQMGNQVNIGCIGAVPTLVQGTMQVAYTVSVEPDLSVYCTPVRQ